MVTAHAPTEAILHRSYRVGAVALRAWTIEAIAVCGVLSFAVAGRLPQLLTIPAFTDEVEEIELALAIFREGARPLTNVDPYIGPLWNYAVAGAFWLVGPSIAVPRGMALLAGGLTVLLTYLLGRVWAGPRVGVLGALLLGVSAAHIAVNSHVAWSNCVTPLFATAGLLAVAVALRDGRPGLLPVAGLLLGLAFHTHPTAAPVIVGSALAIGLARAQWLATPWPYLAALAGLLGNANLIVYNVLTNGRTFRYAQEIQASYVQESGPPTSYVERVGDLLLGLARALGSGLERRPTALDYLLDPPLLVAVTLALLGLVLVIRRRSWLQLFPVISAILMLPLINPKYDPILNVRYLAPILPICLLWIAQALAWLADWASPRAALGSEHVTPGARTLNGVGIVLAAILATILVTNAGTALQRYYGDVQENARTGTRILDVVERAKAAGPSGLPVVLDERLDRVTLGPGAGIVLRVLRLNLALEGIPTEERWLGENRPADVAVGQFVVLAARSKPQFTAEAVAALGLTAVDGAPARVHSQASRYGIYRFGAVPGGKKPGKTAAVSAARAGQPAGNR